MAAELIVTDARVYTVAGPAPAARQERPGAARPDAEALAVGHGRVLAAGRAADVEALAGPGTRTYRLGGRTVVPGLIDAHLHLLGFGLGLERVELGDAPTLAAGLARIAAAVAGTAPGEWVLGAGWDRNRWGGLPTRAELDAVAPGNPALFASRDGHAAWASSLALRLAGIGPTTPSPAGGEVVRDAAGEPTGLLLENAAGLAWAAVPPPTPERCQRALRVALRLAVARGLTGVQSFEGAATLAALQQLRASGDLPLRVCCHLWREALPDALRLGLRSGFGDEWLRLGHLKLFLDGALGSRTAHMLEPYAGSDDRGIAALPADELREIVLAAAAGGIAPALHAIGDAANRAALDVLAATAAAWRPAGLRPRIEHVQLLHPADADRLGRLGVVASMQPSHAPSDWPVAARHWAGRTALAYAWRTLLDSAATLAFGSDCPVEPIDPLLGLHAAVTRQTAAGEPPGGWHPEQRLGPLEALRAYTLGAAYASGEETIKGSLAPGKLADFVVLSEDPLAGPPEACLRACVEATVVGGWLVHGAL